MNESAPRPDTDVPAASAPPPRAHARAVPPRRGRRRALLTLLAFAALLAGGYVLLEARREVALQREAAAQRASEASEASARAEAAARQAQEAQQRLAELELSAADSAAAAPEAAVGRDEATLLEVERLVTLAVHDLQLTRQTTTALAALQLADARLAAANAPRWQAMRRALARDIERLRAVPAIDTTGIALRLDQMIASADVWPMIAAATVAPAAPPKPAPRAAAKKAEPAPELAPAAPPALWARVRGWITQEFGDLIRIREVDTPEALLLNDAQQKLVRQQLKLRLLGARLALLARSDRLYHADIDNAQTLLALYFDGKNAAVAAAATSLRQLNSTALALEPPALSDSQAALRGARARRRAQ